MNKQLYILKTKLIKKNCLDAIYQIKQEDGVYQVTIEKYVEDKTEAQRNFWHHLIGAFAEFSGVTKPQMKSYLKEEILGLDEYELNGVTKTREYSSEDEKKYGYSTLIECTYVIAAEMGCILPSSDIRKR